MSNSDIRSQRRAATDAPIGRRARQREAQVKAARQRRLRVLLGAGTGVLIIVIIVVALLLSRQSSPPSTTASLVDTSKLSPAASLLPLGTQAPSFDLTTVDGTHSRLADLQGHPVLLEFFAVWCPHCQREAAVLNQLEQAYAAKGLRTLAVLANPYGRNYEDSQGQNLSLVSRADVLWFESTFKVTHPTLIDPSFATVNRYGAGSYPTLYVLDRAGRVRFAQSGEVPYQQLAGAITAASKG